MRTLLIAAAAAILPWVPAAVSAQQHHHHGHHGNCIACRNHEYGNPDLFYNFYVPPTCGGMGGEMYPAPGLVPAYVGQTYFTYQPLMPHEFLYKHRRVYHRYYNEGRGLTRTSVNWH
jgi:hypothetical protein